MARQVMVVDDTASHTESATNTVAEIQAKLAERHWPTMGRRLKQ